MIRRIFATTALALLTLSPFAALAQTGIPSAQLPSGAVNCFQYYTFGSIQANIQSNVVSAVSGTPITFTGTLSNANPYPVIDGTLYVKVFKERGNGIAKDVNGPDVVDQYIVRQGIDLPAHGSLPIAFTWDIPSYAQSGEYEVATFFISGKKYNLLGLSFTDDVVGNTAPFRVSGELSKDVSFEKTAVTVGGHSYRFAAFPPTQDKAAPVPVKAMIVNATDKQATVMVDWDLYYWDAQLAQNHIDHKEVPVTIPAHSSAPITYTATDSAYPVYLLTATLHWGNTQSIINVRFVRQGLDRLRINFPGITQFPLTAGSATTLFSCLYNGGASPVVSDGRLDLSLVDDAGALIHQYSYTGAVTGAMMGVADSFTPTRGYDAFTLVAKLYQGSTLVDQSSMRYDCKSIDPTHCLTSEQKAAPIGIFSWPVLGGGTLIIILLVAFTLWRRRAPQDLIS